MENSELAGAFVFDLLSQNKTEFKINTSGSVGPSKTIFWYWDLMKKSAEKTIKSLEWNKDDEIFICLPVDKTGGLMMLVRALLLKCKYTVVNAASDPMLHLDNNHSFTLVSLTPHQFLTIASNPESFEKLNKFRHILLGGGPVSENLLTIVEKCTPAVFHTYGMTETYSHIALQKLNHGKDLYFKAFKDINLEIGENNCLIIHSPDFGKIETTDMAKLFDENQFEIVGRADWIINTGGVKINPEEVEKAISMAIPKNTKFYIGSEPDEVLGQKVVLFIDGEISELNIIKIQELALKVNRYAKPQKVIYKTIGITANGKLLRN